MDFDELIDKALGKYVRINLVFGYSIEGSCVTYFDEEEDYDDTYGIGIKQVTDGTEWIYQAKPEDVISVEVLDPPSP